MVCELDGPMPILKISKTLKVMRETRSCSDPMLLTPVDHTLRRGVAQARTQVQSDKDPP
jgi:hypothetical protein